MAARKKAAGRQGAEPTFEDRLEALERPVHSAARKAKAIGIPKEEMEQVVALTEVSGRTDKPSAESKNPYKISGLATNDGESAGTSKFGTLLAMVVSAVNQVASVVSSDFDSDWDGAAAMDGVE